MLAWVLHSLPAASRAQVPMPLPLQPRHLALPAALLGAAMAGAAAAADSSSHSVSGQVGLATEYVFRGISQTEEKPQLQGEVSWSHDSGVYVGVWSANTHFGGAGNSIEIDPFIGFAGDFGESGWSYDVGYWHYHYPGARSDLDYGELYGVLSYQLQALTLQGSAWYAFDYFGTDFFGDEPALALQAQASYDLGNGFSVSARFGVQTFDEPAGLDGQDFRYGSLVLSREWRRFTLELAGHDTDGVEPDLVAADLADPRLVGRIAVSF